MKPILDSDSYPADAWILGMFEGQISSTTHVERRKKEAAEQQIEGGEDCYG